MAIELLPSCCDFGPAADLEAMFSHVPAKWVVYLFTDADDRPIQLLCVRNLRASLRRRLGVDEADAASKRIDYRQLVRRIHWQRVDSELEADLLYLDLARRLFPESYAKLVSARPAWFVQVNPAAEHPRYTRTTDVTVAAGTLFGPLEDKSDAGKLVDQIEDWFDLCRYHNILVEAPHGKACAYKEMGKCPAPCDGSITLEQYRRLVEWSAATLADPADFIRGHERRMQQAAAELKFEAAAKIRQYVESISALGKGPYRHLRRLRDFRYVSVQRGPTAKSAKLFLVTPATIVQIASFLDAPTAASGVLREALSKAEELAGLPIDAQAIERIGVVARHLFSTKSGGTFIPLDGLDDRSLAQAYRDLRKQKLSDSGDDEGVVRELAAP